MDEARTGGVRDALLGRRSVRAFLSTPVERVVLEQILSAASRSPSGTNMQPWRVYVVTGDARERLSSLVLATRDAEPDRERGPRPFGEYDYNPEPLAEPYKSRRSKVGWDLYKLLNVAKGDRRASWLAAGRNFEFFGAPVGMIFTIDRYLQKGSWLDYGIFLQSIMLAARDFDLHTCCQAAWRHYHDVIRTAIGIPENEVIVCGMSLGYADPNAPANLLRSEREPIESFVRFVDAVHIHSSPPPQSPQAEKAHAPS
jgi:nitroreductase